MIRDITLGQYYPVDSIIHRLDPRTKLFGTMVFIVSLFMADSLWGYLAATAVLAAVVRCSNVPFKFMVKGLKAVVFLLIISVSFNLFLTPGTPLVQFWIFKITREGIRLAVFMGLRLIYLVIGSSVMTLTTTPNQLTDGLEKGLHFLNKVHVPVHEIAMMMSIALRFIPILVEETDKIMVPLFISAFRRATDLAMAMEARCYRGGEGRTKMKPLKYRGADRAAYALFFVYLAVLTVIRLAV